MSLRTLNCQAHFRQTLARLWTTPGRPHHCHHAKSKGYKNCRLLYTAKQRLQPGRLRWHWNMRGSQRAGPTSSFSMRQAKHQKASASSRMTQSSGAARSDMPCTAPGAPIIAAHVMQEGCVKAGHGCHWKVYSSSIHA